MTSATQPPHHWSEIASSPSAEVICITCFPGCDDERVADPLLELADRGRVRLEPVRPSPGEKWLVTVITMSKYLACVDIKPAAVRHLLLGPVAGGVEVHAGEAPTALAATKSELM